MGCLYGLQYRSNIDLNVLASSCYCIRLELLTAMQPRLYRLRVVVAPFVGHIIALKLKSYIRQNKYLVYHHDNDADWLLALTQNGVVTVGNNETTPLWPESLLGEFTKESESRVTETNCRADISVSLLPHR